MYLVQLLDFFNVISPFFFIFCIVRLSICMYVRFFVSVRWSDILFVYLYLFPYLSICISFRISLSDSLFPFVFYLCLSFLLFSICVSLSLFINYFSPMNSLFLFIYEYTFHLSCFPLFPYFSICFSLSLFFYLSLSFLICLSDSLFPYLTICLSLSLYANYFSPMDRPIMALFCNNFCLERERNSTDRIRDRTRLWRPGHPGYYLLEASPLSIYQYSSISKFILGLIPI